MSASPLFRVVLERGRAVTSGLASSTGYELAVDINPLADPSEVNASGNLLRFIGRHFYDSGRPLKPGEKIDWASSLLVARNAALGVLALDEMAFDGESIHVGVSRCARIWAQQSEICNRMKSRFLPARFGSLLAVSPGALEWSGSLEGARYEGPGEMSGWWIFKDGYDGSLHDFATMGTEHVFHALEHQPRLAPYLGLETGFRFRIESDGSVQIWFENIKSTTP